MRKVVTTFLHERVPRETRGIKLAICMIALAVGYAYVWLPVTRERDRLLIRVPELRAEEAAMARDAREFQALATTARVPPDVQAAIRQANAASRLPDSALEVVRSDANQVRVTIATVRADLAFTWAARLQSAAGVRIDSIRVTSLGSDELVRVQAAVSRR